MEKMAFDIETYDPGLIESGTGVQRKDGYILGTGVVTSDGHRAYYDFGHRGCSASEAASNREKVRNLLADPRYVKIGANPLYDMDWLVNGEKMKVAGTVIDVQGTEALLDEYRATYSLDSLGEKYLKRGKKKDEIQEFCDARGLKGDPRQHLYLMPRDLVGRYCVEDCRVTLDVHDKQMPIIASQDLQQVFDMECALLPLLTQMKGVGVRIDRDARRSLIADMKARIRKEEAAFFSTYGEVNFNSTAQLVPLFERYGLSYDKTERGGPSIKKETLERNDHPIANQILLIREMNKLLGTFVEGAFVDYDVNGRIYCEFLPLRKDEGGTVSGRFSSRNPNLEQVPAEKDPLDKSGREHPFNSRVREIFVPEEGCDWGCMDYAQVEYRIISHYARGNGAEVVQEAYRENPDLDYHAFVQGMAEKMGHPLDRVTTKRLNFGVAYFMGAASMSRKFNWPLEQAEMMMENYMRAIPFIVPTRSQVVNIGRARGYIKTILGRRARLPPEGAKKAYVMFNRLIQGTAADLFKKQMVDAYRAGLFEVLTPHIIVHDEWDVSIPRTRIGREAYAELNHLMEEVYPLRVPLRAGAECGPNWGSTKKIPDLKKWIEEV